MTQRIRVESGYLGHDARVFYIDGDQETEISRCVKGLDLHLRVGEVNTASLHVLLAGGRLDAEVENVIVQNLLPRRRWRRMFDVTSFGSAARRFLRQ